MSSTSSQSDQLKLKKALNKDYSYPQPEDKNFLEKIFKMRQFYYYKIPERKKLENYDEIKKYRDDVCTGEFKFREQQNFLTNFMSPQTPFKGILVFHGVGTGKTCSSIAIAEQFKDIVRKYNTKVYVLVGGPNIKENFKGELLFCTGETYLKNKDDIDNDKKGALNAASQFYKIMSYKTFYKKVLGEKIVDKSGDKKEYKKTDKGKFEREQVIDKITHMNNSVLIVDEAHNLSGNEYGKALHKIIKKSHNLKVILLTATPMKNLGDDIIEMLNFLRPRNDPIKREKIFTTDKNYEMDLRPTGAEYLKNKAKGYVSFFRGSVPYTFADRVDMGKVPDELLFTSVIKCYMLPFQLEAYKKTKKVEDFLDKGSSAAANFVFPIFDSNKKITGTYSIDGMAQVINQINSYGIEYHSAINKKFFDNRVQKFDLNKIIYESSRENLTGSIMKIENLKFFSIKFFTALTNLNNLINENVGTAFVYCNLVKIGVNLFHEILIQNGYLEFRENPDEYSIQETTIDYLTGKTFYQMKIDGKEHEFKPATFLSITGETDEGDAENAQEEKQKIIKKYYNNISNIDGSRLKIILGSKVMNEGITLENVSEVHILDVHYNLGKVEQVIGRAVRECKHYNSISDDNKFPEVKIYRYVVSLENELSSEELLYQKAEKKFLTVKKVERILKEVSVDCPLLYNKNVFPEDIEKYKNCVYPTMENKKRGLQLCPALCDFEKCDYKCNEDGLERYYEKTRYKDLLRHELNFNTFNYKMAKSEINMIKEKIKDLYRINHVYTYEKIKDQIMKTIPKDKIDLFEIDFLDQALHELLPISENDFNNFTDTIYDKFNRSGYLILRGKHYIFQPFNQPENVPMYYRQKFDHNFVNNVSLEAYIKFKFKGTLVFDEDKEQLVEEYDFETVMPYYNKRKEHTDVGIIDFNKSKNELNETNDVFKVRKQRDNIKIEKGKKRGTGIPTLKGAVCRNAKDKGEIINLLKSLPNVTKDETKDFKNKNRINLCELLRDKLLFLEKYSKGKDKKTYIMIPANHKTYSFPFNLEDRVEHIKENLEKMFPKITINVKNNKNGSFLGIVNKEYDNYVIKFKEKVDKSSSKYKQLIDMGGKENNGEWTIIVN